jgi:hypothetical protein
MHTENELRDIFSNLASQNVLKYDDLFIALGVKTTRELEDIVIEAFYNDIIHVK